MHTDLDTRDAVQPDALRHSARVAALAALGVAHLDRRLPREGLLGPADVPRGQNLVPTEKRSVRGVW